MHPRQREDFLVRIADALQAAACARDFLDDFPGLLRRHFAPERCLLYYKEADGNVFKAHGAADVSPPPPPIAEEADLIESFTGRNEPLVADARTRMYFDLFDRDSQGLFSRLGINLVVPLRARRHFRGLLLAKVDAGARAAVNALVTAAQAAALMVIPLIETERLELANDKNFYRLFKFDRLVLLGQMAASLAHELRTPLATVLFETAAARNGAAGAEAVTAACDKIDHEVNRASRLVQSLLVFSKFKDLRSASFPLREFVERTLAEIPASKIPANVAVRVLADQEIQVTCDGDRLKQVFMNVLFNALEAMAGGPGGSVEVRVYSEYDELPRNLHHVIAVCDTGPGIPDAIKDRVLEPFFTTKKEGTGLGLYISYSIMKTLKGDLEIHSSSQGTRVNLILPAR